MSTTMTLGSYNFTPVPLMRLGVTPNKTSAGEILGFTYQMTLSGDLILQSGHSILEIDEMQDDLTAAVQVGDGQNFVIECDTETILDCYPRITNGPVFEQGQWVNRSPYTIDMEFDVLFTGSGFSQYISEYNEEWAFEFPEDKTQFSWQVNGETDFLPFTGRVTHNVSATGKSVYDSGGLEKSAFLQAKDFVASKLGMDTQFIENSGIINLSAANFGFFNHYRTINANEAAGTYAVNESWLIVGDNDFPSGTGVSQGNALEDFTISVNKSNESRFYEVRIEGSVQGLETRTYGTGVGDFQITEQRYDAAVDYFNAISDRFYGRCQLVLDNTYPSLNRDLNIISLADSTSHNPYLGTIQYSKAFNDRPSNCLIDSSGNAVSNESITITDNHGGDMFASIFVLGRTKGPVLQNLGTRSQKTRSCQIECLMTPADICPTGSSAVTTLINSCKPYNIDIIVSGIGEQSLSGTVFRNEDQESIDIKNGRYTRSVTWTYGEC